MEWTIIVNRMRRKINRQTALCNLNNARFHLLIANAQTKALTNGITKCLCWLFCPLCPKISKVWFFFGKSMEELMAWKASRPECIRPRSPQLTAAALWLAVKWTGEASQYIGVVPCVRYFDQVTAHAPNFEIVEQWPATFPTPFSTTTGMCTDNRHTPSGQSRVYRVTQLRTDGVHCRESAGTGPKTSR